MRRTILVTGAEGFIGRNLCVALARVPDLTVLKFDVCNTAKQLADFARVADLVFHLAGVNRPEREEEFTAGNVDSLAALLAAIEEVGKRPVIVLSSSTQADLGNPYGRSKLEAEKMLEAYSGRTSAPAVAFRLPGVFGKWCRPNYNSAVATFCHNIARSLPITVSDPAKSLELVYIDDVVEAFLALLPEPPQGVERRAVQPVFSCSLGELAGRIRSFEESRRTLQAPDFADPFTKRLYATFTSYLEPGNFAYGLQVRADVRGELAEFLKQPHFGQLFVSRTRPCITRGNHYHDTKAEKFLVVEGEAVIRFRKIGSREVIEHRVSGKDFRPVDIPPGYTHHIENVGSGDLVTLFWAGELFDAARPDTHPLAVSETED